MSCAPQPRLRRRQPGRARIRGRLHNLHLLYLFTDVAGLRPRTGPRETASAAPAPPGMGVASSSQTPRLAGCGATSPLFFYASLRRKVRHPAALRERAAVTGSTSRTPGTARGPLSESLSNGARGRAGVGAAPLIAFERRTWKGRGRSLNRFRTAHVEGPGSAPLIAFERRTWKGRGPLP